MRSELIWPSFLLQPSSPTYLMFLPNMLCKYYIQYGQRDRLLCTICPHGRIPVQSIYFYYMPLEILQIVNAIYYYYYILSQVFFLPWYFSP
jgi:hypothetical protein